MAWGESEAYKFGPLKLKPPFMHALLDTGSMFVTHHGLHVYYTSELYTTLYYMF